MCTCVHVCEFVYVYVCDHCVNYLGEKVNVTFCSTMCVFAVAIVVGVVVGGGGVVVVVVVVAAACVNGHVDVYEYVCVRMCARVAVH